VPIIIAVTDLILNNISKNIPSPTYNSADKQHRQTHTLGRMNDVCFIDETEWTSTRQTPGIIMATTNETGPN